jgi:hypothetical protein
MDRAGVSIGPTETMAQRGSFPPGWLKSLWWILSRWTIVFLQCGGSSRHVHRREKSELSPDILLYSIQDVFLVQIYVKELHDMIGA